MQNGTRSKGGRYLARATSPASFGFSKTKDGKPTIGVRITLLEGPRKGSTAIWWGNFTDGSWERSAESLRLLGWRGTDIKTLVLDTSAEVLADLEIEQTEEGERVRIAWVNPVAVTSERPLDGEALDDFATWFAEAVTSAQI